MGEQTLLILGATGDLTRRLLLPGLGGLLTAGRGDALNVIGSSRVELDDADWRQLVADALAAGGAAGTEAEGVVALSRYLQADVGREDDLRRLVDASGRRPIVFFALPPAVTVTACETLARIDLPPETRLMLEKPFGTDAASAAALNERLAQLVPEDHVHRVDHYLGMSTVLNILGLRFANRALEPVLTAEHVASIDIFFDETLGLEGRAGYYDRAGALIDMIQSHSLQVLSLLTMEAPSTLHARDVRDGTAQVLRASRVWDNAPERWSRRARYTAGEVGGRWLPAYADEVGVDPTRHTETLAEVVLAVDTWRWAGVPFRLRAGKALADQRKQVVVTFKQPRWVPRGLTGYDKPDRLRIGLDPDIIGLDLNVSGRGHPLEIDPLTLEAGVGAGYLPPYGAVLKGALEGDPTLSVRGDTAVDGWRIVEPVLDAWRADRVPLEEYPAGSSGPVGW
jgi:glucose-6-phosphate 1-dehydrogenase